MRAEELIAESQRIHALCMFEVVRQVSVHCVERGVLLKRVWEYVPCTVGTGKEEGAETWLLA